MKVSTFECQYCGSRRLRRSQRTTFSEYAGVLAGRYPVRCVDCGKRSVINILLLSKFTVAKCPLCLEMNLGSWDIKHYHLPAWKKWLISLGANRYRCNACRYNFLSFRRLAKREPGEKE